ncbi:MAG: hypothetical protein KTR31_05565 [Myxococcales bacterium]|nr:hypothetical protein [Myxococcales bacterium]
MHDDRFVDEEPIEGTSTVVRVWDNQFSLARASRALRDLLAEDWDVVRERVRVLSRLRHPALPQLVAIGDRQGVLCLVEEWVEGRSLDAIVSEDGPLPFPEVQKLLEPVVDALVLVHSMGIAHGGVDAHSVLRDQVGAPMLVGVGAHSADLQHDVADLALLLSEVIQAPMPQSVDELIEAAMTEEVVDMVTFSQRLFAISELPPSTETGPLDMDFDFEPDLGIPSDFDDIEIAPQSRTTATLMMVAIAILGIGGVLAWWLASGSEEVAAEESMAPEEAAEVVEAAPEAGSEEPAAREAPEPAPQTAKIPPGSLGRWEVVRDVAQPARVVLQANDIVEDRNGRSGRPSLSMACVEGELQAVLEPGVRRVEAVAEPQTYALYAELSLSHPGATSPIALRADLEHGDARVHLRRARQLAAAIDGPERITVGFVPFASEPVQTTFDARGAVAALNRLVGCGSEDGAGPAESG